MNADASAGASSGSALQTTQPNWIECQRTVRRPQASIVKVTCLAAWSGFAHAGLCNGLSRMRRKFHVRF